MRPPRKAPDRLILALVVCGAHLLVIWWARNWTLSQRPRRVIDEFASVLFFLPERAQPTTSRKPKLPPTPSRSATLGPPPAPFESAVGESTVITQQVNPPRVDWDRELDSAATTTIQNALRDAQRANAFTHQFDPSPSMRPLHEPHRDYEWYVHHSRQVINAYGVPEWVLSQPCDPVMLKVDPNCTVDRVEKHGVLFEYMEQVTGRALDYDGPNAIP